MIWILAGAALATVIALGGAAFWLFRHSGGVRLHAPEDAMQVADQAIPGFVSLSAAVGRDGQAALVFGEGARVAVVRVRRAGPAAREIVWGNVRATRDGMLVATGDWRLGTVLIADVDNLDVRRLAPQLTRG